MEKTDLTSLLASRNEELVAMDNQLKELSERLTTITEKNVDSNLKIEIVSLREVSLNQREARLEQESELKNRRILNLESELERITQELLSARRELTTATSDLESKLEEKNDQVKRLKEELIHVKNGCVAKDNHMSMLSAKLRTQLELAEKLQKQYSEQTQSFQEMLTIQSSSLENERKRSEKLVAAVQELQDLLKCSKESHSEMERQLVEKSTEYEEAISSKDYAVRKLEREIDALKDKLRIDPRQQLEQELEIFYPAASKASRSMRERSLFVAQATVGEMDELNRLREENARLISEAEENAPLTLAKMLEHKKAVEMITQLQNQLTQVMVERNEWLNEKETLIQLSKMNERSVRRFEQENEDLSNQVRALLEALNDAKGPSLGQQVSRYARRGSSGTSANDIVTAHLVTFESIEELQTRNRQLLAAIRELSEQKDANESMAVAVRVPESSSDQLQQALREVEALKKDRMKQTEVIEAVVRQRDALQSIAAAFTPLEPFYRTAPQTNVPDPNTEYVKQKLEEKEKELTNVRKDQLNQAKEANDEIMKLKDEIMQVKIEERNVSSKLESVQSNLESARSIIEQNKTELQTLRDRIIVERKNSKKSDQELKKVKNEITELKEKIRKGENLIKHLTEEKEMFKSSESRLRVEIEGLKRERQTSHSIGETTKTLQAYITRVEADASRAKIAETLVEKLEKENLQLKSRLAKQAKEVAEADESSMKRVEELKKSFSAEQKDEMERLKLQISALRGENQEIRKNALAVKTTIESGASKLKSELEEKLIEKSKEVAKLEAEVQRLNNEVTNLRKICTDKEEKFKRALTQLNSERKAVAEQQQQQPPPPPLDQSTELQSKIDSLQEKLKESMNQTKVALASVQEKDEKLKKVANQARQRIAVLQEQIRALNDEKQALQTQMNEKKNTDSIKSDESALALQQLRSKVSSLEQENEELLRLRLLNANLEAKLKGTEREIQELKDSKLQLEEKLREQQEPIQENVSQQPLGGPTTSITFVAPNVSSIQAPPTQPVRPLPQQQPQPTKTATINPLPHPRPITSTIAHVIPTQQSHLVSSIEAVEDEDISSQDEQGIRFVEPVVEDEQEMVVDEQEASQQEQIQQEEEKEEEQEQDAETSAPPESSQKRSRSESPTNASEPSSSKRSKTNESPAADDTDPATQTSGIESSDTNEDSSDRKQSMPSRPGNIVIDDVIVLDDNSDEEGSNDEAGADESGEEEASESGNDSSADGRESDEEYSRSEAEDDNDQEREVEEDAEQDDGHDDGDDDDDDQDEAVIVIGESNESQNDSHLSGEQVVENEGAERDDVEGSVESTSQPETSSAFNESQASQVFAVPEDQRAITRPTYLGQAGPSYEDSDSIVPSTPTLVVPRRGDGPESLNSPRVPQNSFQFASVSREGSPGEPAADTGDNRLNDSRIDLSQFDENSRQQQAPFETSDDTPQLIVPDESASMSAESVTPEPTNESASIHETSDPSDSQPDQGTDDNRLSQPARQPIIWNAPTSVAPIRAPGPDQPVPIHPPVPGAVGVQQPIRPRRLQLRGARAFQQTARRAGGWRGGRGRGGGATQ